MFCSTIIPTIDRPTLARAVQSVVDQQWPHDDFEIIVVNDSGVPLKPAAWQELPCVHIVTTQRRERSVARNAGAAVARGEFLHFLDDDDWLLPEAFAQFQKLVQSRSADWYYGGTQLVDRSGAPLLQLHHHMQGNCFTHVMAGEWIPLQSSLIRTVAFVRCGGFNPAITGPEDVDLCRRILLRGSLAGTNAVVAAVEMGETGSTTDWAHHANASRVAREQILDQPGVLRRLLASAHDAATHGRVVRIYLTSAVWNLQRARLFHAASRVLFAEVALCCSLRWLTSRLFWRSILSDYESPTFARGHEARTETPNPMPPLQPLSRGHLPDSTGMHYEKN